MNSFELSEKLLKVPFALRNEALADLMRAEEAPKLIVPPEVRALNAEERNWLLGHLRTGVKNMCASGRTENLGTWRRTIRMLEACN